MKKCLLVSFILVLFININFSFAQKEKKISDIEFINLGDGRLFCHERDSKTPVEGKVRVIDGYHTAYIDAEFKEGIATGNWKSYKNNTLSEEITYKDGLPEGESKEYFSDGKVASLSYYINGKKTGKWITYYPDGKTESEKVYKDGKPDGKWVTYYTSGKIESEKGFKDGIEDGIERRYDKDGKLTSDSQYTDGKTVGKVSKHYSSNTGDYTLNANYNSRGEYDGEYSEIFDNGNVKVKGSYSNGKKNGPWEYGKKDGQKIRTDEYANDDKVKETIYYTDGTVEVVRELKNGKKNGYERKYTYGDGSLKSELYYKDGQLASADAGSGTKTSSGSKSNTAGLIKQTKQITSNLGSYTQTFYQVNNKYEGEYTEKYVDGGGMKMKGQYTNGLKQGKWSYEDNDGKLEKEENYLDGKLNGLVTKYSRGTISESQEYKNDIRNGECKQYNTDGKLVLKGNYANDKRQGPMEEYYPSGKIKTKVNYDNNKRNGVEQTFYTNGKMQTETTYVEGGLEGPFKQWAEDGQLTSEGNQKGSRYIYCNSYENGKLTAKQYEDEDGIKHYDYYDENGKLKAK